MTLHEPALRHGDLMDRIYRHQRHIYDVTRKYYLLGRDRALDALDPPPGGRVLEIGCGTGRNLLAVARRRPDVRVFGLDISSEMLASSGARIARAGLVDRIRIAEADAAATDPRRVFGVDGFDRVLFSYTLSMIPDWPAAMRRAVEALAPGGRLHVVDFGGQEGLPRAFRTGLRAWLGLFHVTPRADAFFREMRSIARETRATTRQEHLFLGYAWNATMTMPAARTMADA